MDKGLAKEEGRVSENIVKRAEWAAQTLRDAIDQAEDIAHELSSLLDDREGTGEQSRTERDEHGFVKWAGFDPATAYQEQRKTAA